MKVLELFAGSRSFSKAAKKLGMETYTTDFSDFKGIDLVKDILDVNATDIEKEFGIPDVIWASPPCTTFSVASIGYHWTGGKNSYIPKTDKCRNNINVVYRPIKKNGLNGTYEIEEYNGSITYSDVMKHAPLDVCLGATVFFYNLGNELLKGTIAYLEKDTEVQNILLQGNSGKDGDGIVQSMLLLKETLRDLTKLQD